jgi:hypothetical protein
MLCLRKQFSHVKALKSAMATEFCGEPCALVLMKLGTG